VPEETLGRIVDYFREEQGKHGQLKALGIGCFGPVDLHRDSPTYGYVTSTPKNNWTNADFLGPIAREFDVPIGFDTDVNAAALGEWRWGAAQGLDTFVYLTFGTGVGGGGMARGELMRGLIHPEMGHMKLPRDVSRDSYKGRCHYHGDCFEGLAAGPALEERWGARAETFPPDHPAWELEAHYVALGLMNLICILSPQRIILGGGVMLQKHLFPLIRTKTLEVLAGYLQAPQIIDQIDTYIVPPALGNQAGIIGGLALAQRALQEQA
jgi:fructokinase